MVKLRNLTIAVTLVGGLAVGAIATTAMQSAAQQTRVEPNKPSNVVSTSKDSNTIRVECECEEKEKAEHWTVDPLKSLEAEETVEQSIYLSAVQLVKLERAQGDVRDAIPALEDLSAKAPKQGLRNAIRRLLVDISLETNDARGYKEAEKYLQTIIDESLVQY